MSNHDDEAAPPIDEAVSSDPSAPGTAQGEPLAGVEADESDLENAVEPDDEPTDVGGTPPPGGPA